MADEEDIGWAGAWRPMICSDDVQKELQNICGEPLMGANGAPLEWCSVNLRTKEVRYRKSARGGRY